MFGAERDRLLLVRYETLTANPVLVLDTIYDLIEEPRFAHDPNHIEPTYDMIDFDVRLGTPGLHHVRSIVRVETRPLVLPPDLFERFERDAFCNDPARMPSGVPIV
jgi:sulfotransferase